MKVGADSGDLKSSDQLFELALKFRQSCVRVHHVCKGVSDILRNKQRAEPTQQSTTVLNMNLKENIFKLSIHNSHFISAPKSLGVQDLSKHKLVVQGRINVRLMFLSGLS